MSPVPVYADTLMRRVYGMLSQVEEFMLYGVIRMNFMFGKGVIGNLGTIRNFTGEFE